MGNARSARLAVTEQRLDHIARFAFASWLLNIQLVKHMLAMGTLTEGLTLAIIEDAAASSDPIVDADEMKPAWRLMCEMLGLPSDRFHDDDEENEENLDPSGLLSETLSLSDAGA
jgi:hypothetical protein